MPALLVNGIAMQYQEYDAPDAPIVLVQGIGAGGGVWSLHEVPEFVTVRYRVISYDNRGINALPGEKETLFRYQRGRSGRRTSLDSSHTSVDPPTSSAHFGESESRRNSLSRTVISCAGVVAMTAPARHQCRNGSIHQKGNVSCSITGSLFPPRTRRNDCSAEPFGGKPGATHQGERLARDLGKYAAASDEGG